MIKQQVFTICLIVLLFLTSCKTYLIPVDSFKRQFDGIDSSKLREVRVQGPIGETYNYLANPFSIIKCEDKKGNAHELKNSPSLEIRFTYGAKKKRTVFYFDRVYIGDSCIIGVQSRYISSIRKSIPISSVTKIEIQDGKKNFHYIGQ